MLKKILIAVLPLILVAADGSSLTSASCVNPSLSYMAFTARASDYDYDYAVKQLNTEQLES